MSFASVAAQQTRCCGSRQCGNQSASTGRPRRQAGTRALTSLSSNFGDFLNLLMTQLQNQDPSSPLDTNQFTTEQVQFSGVEQQINTNASLTH